jgi:hypothetical protein
MRLLVTRLRNTGIDSVTEPHNFYAALILVSIPTRHYNFLRLQFRNTATPQHILTVTRAKKNRITIDQQFGAGAVGAKAGAASRYGSGLDQKMRFLVTRLRNTGIDSVTEPHHFYTALILVSIPTRRYGLLRLQFRNTTTYSNRKLSNKKNRITIDQQFGAGAGAVGAKAGAASRYGSGFDQKMRSL